MWPQFPDQGSNPCPQHWEHGVLTTGPQGSPLYVTLPRVRWGGSRKWLDLASLSLTASLATQGLSGSGMGTGPPHMSSELEWAGRPSFSDSRQWLEFVWVCLVDGQLLDSSLYYTSELWAAGGFSQWQYHKEPERAKRDHLGTAWSWMSYFSSLCFSFPLCKKGIISRSTSYSYFDY